MTIPEDESLRYKVLHDLDFDLVDDGGSVDPSTLSVLAYGMASDIAEISSGPGLTYVEFDDEFSLQGSDLEVDGGDDTIINVLTDGIYAVTSTTFLAVSGSSVTNCEAQLFVGTTLNNYARGEPVNGNAAFPLSGTCYLMAGATIRLAATAELTGTWDLQGGSNILVQRLA